MLYTDIQLVKPRYFITGQANEVTSAMADPAVHYQSCQRDGVGAEGSNKEKGQTARQEKK